MLDLATAAIAAATLDGLGLRVWAKTRDTRQIVAVSEAALAALGLSREAVIGRTADEIFEPEYAAIVKQHDDEAAQIGKSEWTSNTELGYLRIRIVRRDQYLIGAATA